ncbi:DNA-binding transcriptional regulator, FrmR family [Bifidobacterium bohemicum]|uniref:Metal-sensitive transcriptional repressor domain protein n=1 Tax=Bifidobacterium bohemicum DSM 22767 TaxID=1437606 RepID=A0A086ZJW1_9BIFI|nr:Metal-sensitive transcriptional repressor domain protein [Bifidobacterium bohemicum DSM 22767]SCB81995.1 DNA-binding transcriptional regulator, FrmR family [Bifidobacterium bohemicum]
MAKNINSRNGIKPTRKKSGTTQIDTTAGRPRSAASDVNIRPHGGNAQTQRNATGTKNTDGLHVHDSSDDLTCTHVGYVHDKRKLMARMRRVEGQVHAITSMIESDTYCVDVLTQIAASTSALKSAALILLEDHLNSCVACAAAQGGPVADEKMDEAIAAITRLVKS